MAPKYLIPCLWLIFIHPANAASDDFNKSEQDLRLECSGIGSEVDMAKCLKQKAGESAGQLQDAESKMQTALSRWDESETYIRIAKTRFIESEQAFIEYRKKQCLFAGSLSGGAAGNAREIMRLACIAELNNKRTQQLHDATRQIRHRHTN